MQLSNLEREGEETFRRGISEFESYRYLRVAPTFFIFAANCRRYIRTLEESLPGNKKQEMFAPMVAGTSMCLQYCFRIPTDVPSRERIPFQGS